MFWVGLAQGSLVGMVYVVGLLDSGGPSAAGVVGTLVLSGLIFVPVIYARGLV